MRLVCQFVQLSLWAFIICQAAWDPSKAVLKCDDILKFAFPDLCEMEVIRGSVLVRGFEVVYWRYRNKYGPSDKAPVIIVHGGPGFAHNFMLNMKQQACRGREAVFYDQVGTGESGQPANVTMDAPWLLTIPYYNEEVQAIAAELKWTKFHFYGASWGTVIGQSYALLQDPRLISVALTGPFSDSQLYIKSQWDPIQGNLGSLPLHMQDIMHALDHEKAYDSPLYAKGDEILTFFFTTRTIPLPDCYLAATPTTAGREIYVRMQGPSEFTMKGVLENMNFTPRLQEIQVPVLLSHGRYDTMRPPVVDAMYHNIPRAWRTQMPRSGHCTMIDDPRLENDAVGDFYDHAEAGTLDKYEVPPEARDPGDLPLTSAWQAMSSEPSQQAAANTLLTLIVGISVGGVFGAALMAKLSKKHRPSLTSTFEQTY